MEFHYLAVDAQGKKVTGQTRASSADELANSLAQQNLHLIRSKRKSNTLIGLFQVKHKPIFYLEVSRQLAILLSAGLPLLQALQILIDEAQNKDQKKLLQSLAIGVSQGNLLSVCMSRVGQGFDTRYCDVVAIGEKTGKLAEALEQNYQYLAAKAKLKRQLQKASLYPCIVFLVAISVTLLMLIKVIPEFATLYDNYSQALPWATQTVLSLSQWLQQNYLIAVLFFPLLALALKLSKRHKPVQRKLDYLSAKLPLVGSFIHLNFLLVFCLTSFSLLTAGLPLHQTIVKVRNVVSNSLFVERLQAMEDGLLSGQSFYHCCQQTRLFPPLFMQLVKVGETTGTLEQRLGELIDIYRNKLDDKIEHLLQLLEPAIVIFVGVLVGGLVLAMYMPIFQMSSFI